VSNVPPGLEAAAGGGGEFIGEVTVTLDVPTPLLLLLVMVAVNAAAAARVIDGVNLPGANAADRTCDSLFNPPPPQMK
jgi:hypothetical protein